MMNIKEPFKGYENFQKIINKYDFEFSAYEIGLFIAPFILSPEFIQPSHAVAELLRKDCDDEILFEDLEDAKNFYGQFYALWNEVAGGMTPEISAVISEFKNEDEKLKYIFKRASEVGSFMMSFEEYGLKEMVGFNAELTMCHMSLEIFLNELANFEDEESLTGSSLQEHLTLAEGFPNAWNHVYPKMRKIFLDIRSGEIEPESEEEYERNMKKYLEGPES